jgi:hypothetical protein
MMLMHTMYINVMEKYHKRFNEIKANIPVLAAMLERKEKLFKNENRHEKRKHKLRLRA